MFAQGLTITTVAGDNVLDNGGLPLPGYNGDNIPAIGAKLHTPIGVAIDAAGNIYIGDTLNHRIRKVTKSTGLITTIAGDGTPGFTGDNGPAISARINSPTGVAVDAAGNVFIADQSNNRIRKIATNGIITTIVGNGQNSVYAGEGGPADKAQICFPYSIALDGSGNLFISDSGFHAIRKVAASTQIITTVVNGVQLCGQAGGFSGDGGPAKTTGSLAFVPKLRSPQGITVDAAGTNLYIADTHNSRIRKVVVGGNITTVAGTGASGTGPNGGVCPVVNYNGDGGAPTSALLNWPHSVDVDTSGNLYIADYCNYRIRKVTAATGTITTVAGIGRSGFDGDGVSSTASAISDPTDVRVDSAGNFYIVDQATNRVSKVFPTSGPTNGPPVITQNPSDQFVSVGGTATFQASASGTPASTVQWQVSTNGGGSFSNIPGQTGNIYSFGAVLADNGKRYRAVFTNALGTAATTSALLTVRPPPAIPKTDFDGDAIGDLTVWRPTNGTWFTLTSSNGYNYANVIAHQWGNQSNGDVPMIGDMDGDGLADLVVWRATTGTWYWLSSSTGYSGASFNAKQWGNQSLGDVPMLGDIDGDGRMDLVLWRASSGTWFWLTSSTGYNASGSKQWGSQSSGDVPKLSDIDGDGKADLIVWRAPSGTWLWLTSSTGYANYGLKQFGNQSLGDVPLVGDFDGDGRTELVVWRASTGTWFWLLSTTGYASGSGIQWGSQTSGDVPLLTDLDGDGKVDLTVWRGTTGTWFWLKSLQGYSYSTAGNKQWGSPSQGDIPMVK